MAITAVPVGDSYVGDEVVSAGRFRHPAWRRAMAKYDYAPIETAAVFQSIDPGSSPLYNPNYPSRAPWALTDGGNTNQSTMDGVMIPYCGAAFDQEKCRFWLPLQGGHGDSGNNGNYYQDLNADSPVCVMNRAPSGALPFIAGGLPAGSTPQGNSYLLDDHNETTGIYADGRPRAIHAYRKHVHVPGLGVVCANQGGTFSDVSESTKIVWLLDEVSGEWELKSSVLPSYFGSSKGASACYDSTRGVVVWAGTGLSRFHRLDLTSWTYSAISSTAINTSGDIATVYVAEYDIFIYVCDFFATRFRIIDASTGAITAPTTIGTAQAIIGSSAMEWVPGIGLVCDRTAAGVWALAPTGNPKTDPWEWSQLPVPSLPTLSGDWIWSKFGYSKKLGGCYRYVNSTTKPWFFATE